MLGACSQGDHREAEETDNSRTGPENVRVKTGAHCQTRQHGSYQRLLRWYQNDSGAT